MAYRIPTSQEVFDRNLANFESKLNQETPLVDRAFLRVLAAVEATNYTELNRYAANLVLQNFAITATEEDLDRIGSEYGIARKPAVAAQVLLNVTATTTGVTLPAGTTFVGDSNRITYATNTTETQSGASLVVQVVATSLLAGEAGNLAAADTLTIEILNSDFEPVADVASLEVIGIERETDDEYRRRILGVIRAIGGGGDAFDYRVWAEETPGVVRAYPYSAKPLGSTPFTPGDRTVYVEASTAIDPDGIAPASLLDDARDYINNDPISGQSRPPLGLTDSTLWVESITRIGVSVEIRSLTVDAALLADAKTLISTNLDLYLRNVEPFVDGLDAPLIRNDTITNLSISDIVQDALTQFAGSAESIGFYISIGSFLLSYQLQQGERAKLSTVSYV